MRQTLLTLWLCGLPLVSLAQTPAGQSSIVIAPDAEPGQRLVVDGQVLTREGKTVPDAEVYVYHTDARGYYSASGQDERNPKLKGRLRTDARGRYSFRSIRPAPYPGGGPPAHVHYEVTIKPGDVQRFELVFDGDARLTPEIRTQAAARDFYAICKPTTDGDGTQRCRDANLFLK